MDTPSKTIVRLIERLQGMSNSKVRNKTISKLDDALVWAEKLQDPQTMQAAGQLPKPSANATPGSADCTCKPGMFSATCPIHYDYAG